MRHDTHPDDERLAALAASEADALADSSLVTHVAECARCAPMVDELRTLHSALAELPDLQPSRPLRFLPPVPEPATRSPRWHGLLRGITGPAMAVAIILIVVGAFGTAFNGGFGIGAAGGAPGDLTAGHVANGAPSAASSSRAAESSKEQPPNLGASASPAYPVAAGSRSAPASPTASASSTNDERLQQQFGSNTQTGVSREGAPPQPPFGLILGLGVVLLAAAFVARGYLRRRAFA